MIARMIKIGQKVEYNIMEWVKYYNHTKITGINIKGFNDANYLVLGISFLDKNNEKQLHHLTVGIHKDELIKNDNYKVFLFDFFRSIPINIEGYFEKYGLEKTINVIE